MTIAKIHKTNLIIIWSAIAALIGLAFANFGASRTSLIETAVMVVCGIISTAGYFMNIDDVKKGLILVMPPALGTLIFSGLSGGNGVAFFANFVLLAMAAAYFMKKTILWFSVPYSAISFIILLIDPKVIDGKTGSFGGGLTKLVLYIISAVLIYNCVKRGSGIVEETEETLDMVKKNADIANDISGKLNSAIVKSQDVVQILVDASRNVEQSTRRMGELVEVTADTAAEVVVSVDSANKDIDNNYQLAKQMDEGFEGVLSAVRDGNDAVVTAKDFISGMEVTVSGAKTSTESLLEEMSRITSILDEINSIASQTNLLSLNASIEAARAGEHGRGFAVVADEIRQLSEQSAGAANNIGNILEQLKDRIKEVAGEITNGAEAASSSVEKVEDILAVFERITETTRAAKENVDQEYGIIDNVRAQFEQIRKNMDAMVASTKDSTEAISGISGTVEDQNLAIQNISGEMDRIVVLSEELETQFKK